MLVVLALGGNALLRRGEPLEAESQRRKVLDAAGRLRPSARWEMPRLWCAELAARSCFLPAPRNECRGGVICVPWA